MSSMDELSGYEFEDLMEDVFRKLGYENVRQSKRTGDEGRDILMEEVVDGQRRAVVVECKHQESVSRPVVQKLHSAVSTYEYDGPKRGIVVTTGRFTDPAEEYAQKASRNGAGPSIDLIDGRELREIGETVGLDMRNGRIEVVCDRTLRPYDPTGTPDGPIREVMGTIENLEAASVPIDHRSVVFRPVLIVRAETDAVFETSVGVIHSIDETDTFVIHADRGRPDLSEGAVRELIVNNTMHTTELAEGTFREQFDDLEIRRFGQTETEYKEWVVDRLQEIHTTTVEYTGGNNVDYEKTCTPNQSDISVQSIEPVYLPQVRTIARLQQYSYPYEFYNAGPSRVTIEDGVRRCVQCGDTEASTYTYCENCGSINCGSHVRTERLEGTPVCTGCAVTERFALKTKYFYDDQNLEAFREEYAEMGIHKKAMENKPLAGGSVLTTIALVLVLLLQFGVI